MRRVDRGEGVGEKEKRESKGGRRKTAMTVLEKNRQGEEEK